ncbi:neuronal acetylcholine receptor subunit alpha-10-like isoform X2 [Ptychodera flava]|uniref:neuronal acetylcholine receptor subunit alpha-10-like isoform X2 n=1 Tax=Ptychodera flava TaxID=63121 RepID=UPI00396A9079
MRRLRTSAHPNRWTYLILGICFFNISVKCQSTAESSVTSLPPASSLLQTTLPESDSTTELTTSATKTSSGSSFYTDSFSATVPSDSPNTTDGQHDHNTIEIVSGYETVELQEAGVIHDLTKSYNKMVRPTKNYTDSLQVTLTLSLNTIIDMNEVNQVLTSSVWMRQEWTDAGLVWNPSDYYGVDEIRLPSSDLWTPDIVLYNNAADSFEGGVMPTNAIVQSDGTVTWLSPAILKSACRLDPLFFPFDTQNCSLRFGSWSYDGYQLNLTTRGSEADTSVYSSNGEWELLGMPVEVHLVRYACCDTPYPDVRFYIILQRLSLFYMFNLVIPCIMISSLVLFVFQLPSDAGEKITLSITILLSLAVFLLLVAETMPPTSDVVPLIGQYFASCIILVGLSTGATVMAAANHHHGDSTEVPPWVRYLVLDKMACCVGLRSNFAVSPEDEEGGAGEGDDDASRPPLPGGVINPVFEDDDPSFMVDGASGGADGGAAAAIMMEEIIPDEGTSLIDRYVEQIARNVEYVAKREEQQDKSEAIATEWKHVAMVLDRFCLLVFTAVTVALTLTFMLMAANHVSVVKF